MMKTGIPVSRRAFLQAGFSVMGSAALGAGGDQRLRVAFIGLGGRSKPLLKECLQYGGSVVALCDADARQLPEPMGVVSKAGGKAVQVTDYRRLLDGSVGFDAAVIATPDHWHAPLCRAFMSAGKHVYCEKPLTHSVGEARELRGLVKKSGVVTQLGNQGSASASLRRSVELVKAGLLGQVREAHIWVSGFRGADAVDTRMGEAIPPGFDWDMWLGPAPERPYKAKVYHPGRWRYWWDFGSGTLGDFGCHGFNLPVRALDLGWPDRIKVDLEAKDGERYMTGVLAHLQFPARGKLNAMTAQWYDGDRFPAKELMNDVVATYGTAPKTGCMLVGESGTICADVWGNGAVLKLKGDSKFTGVLKHEGAKEVMESLPRTPNHMKEWLEACKGHGKTFSDFETGGRLTEIVLAGALAVRVGRDIAWDGEAMRVADEPRAEAFIHPQCRAKWLVPMA